MVDLSERVAAIKEMVDAGEYFTINRARQYGKTTTMTALREYLKEEYLVLSLDFQGIGKDGFSTEKTFVQEFCRLVWNKIRANEEVPGDIRDIIRKWKESEEPRIRLGELFDLLTDWCEQKRCST